MSTTLYLELHVITSKTHPLDCTTTKARTIEQTLSQATSEEITAVSRNIRSTLLFHHTLHILTCMLASRTLVLPYVIVEIVQSMCDSDTSRVQLPCLAAPRDGGFSSHIHRLGVTPLQLVHIWQHMVAQTFVHVQEV